MFFVGIFEVLSAHDSGWYLEIKRSELKFIQDRLKPNPSAADVSKAWQELRKRIVLKLFQLACVLQSVMRHAVIATCDLGQELYMEFG